MPVPYGPWAYYSRTEQGRPYRIYCRRPRGGGAEQILLDVNALAEGRDYVSVGDLEVSPDHRILAYSTDFSGREIFTLRFLDLDTGEHLPDTIDGSNGSITWANDAKTVFWTALDAAQRSWRVHRHELGTPGPGPVVLEEPDERLRVGTWKGRSGRFVYLAVMNAVQSELHVIPADAPATPPRCLQPRIRGLRYKASDGPDRFWIVTNLAEDAEGRQTDAAPDFRLMTAPLDATGKDAWREVLPHRPRVQLVDVDAFADFVVLTERDHGQLRLRLIEPDGRDRYVPLPEPVCVVHVGDNREFATDRVRFVYTSMTTPESVFSARVDTLEVERLKETPVPGYDRTRYRTARWEAVAEDGARIPMSAVWRADLDPTAGPHPTVLYGYGSYGITIDPVFTPTRVSLLDRGVVFVIAHVRGGGFLGRAWYEAAKFKTKERTFDDFVACARHLHAMGVATPQTTLIYGGSAGGLLIGAVMNRAPEVAAAALAAVPFVDVVTTMLDESLPLTAPEWEEWGDPRERDYFEVMLSYSPYDNVRPQRYPDLLVICGLNDPRVQYWEPTKWVARLREVATGGEFLQWTHLGAGHAGRSGRYGWLEDKAFEMAWMLWKLGRAG